MINLGTLKEITDLRSIWPHEALNFTPWVAENVELLADAVGLDITVDAGDARDIADPWYTGNFDVTYEDVKEGCEAFLQYLIENEPLY